MGSTGQGFSVVVGILWALLGDLRGLSRVLEVDPQRKRISLSMKLDAASARRDGSRENRFEGAGRGQRPTVQRPSEPASHSAMASAFAKLQGLRK